MILRGRQATQCYNGLKYVSDACLEMTDVKTSIMFEGVGMSKLPNAARAFIPLEKLTEYTLNPEHPTGRHKAYVFKSVLGLSIEDAPFLYQAIQAILTTHEAEYEGINPYGARYVVDFELTTAAGQAMVRTSWIIRNGEDLPRLTSCYVK